MPNDNVPADAGHIPPALIASLEAQLGGRIIHTIPRAGNGASRMGAQLTIAIGGGDETHAYLSFDTRIDDPRRPEVFQREVGILTALSGIYADAQIPAPRLLASDRSHLALLTSLVPGRDRFDRATPAELRYPVECDMIAQIARLHRLDPRKARIDGFDDPAIPNSTRISQRIAELRADNLASAPDPILQLSLDWLARNIPADNAPSVIVHGDAGGGNFLFEGDRVTALLDWELSHHGDPMEDLAQMWVREMFNPFMGPGQMIAAYEAAGGFPVDLDRVRFHRLYFQMSFMVANHANLHGPKPVPTALIGTTLLFEAAHLHVVVRSLSELTGIALADVPLPRAAPGIADHGYATALEDLSSVIVPRAADQQARAKATSLARLVKYWRNRDRDGATFDQAEITEVASALGESVVSVRDARERLAYAIAGQQVDFETALQLCNRRVVRHTALMGEAMGSLKNCYFAPLDD